VGTDPIAVIFASILRGVVLTISEVEATFQGRRSKVGAADSVKFDREKSSSSAAQTIPSLASTPAFHLAPVEVGHDGGLGDGDHLRRAKARNTMQSHHSEHGGY
jgi:hypothetical protein